MMTKKQKTRWYLGFIVVVLGLGLIFASCNRDKSSVNPASPAITGEGKADFTTTAGAAFWGYWYEPGANYFRVQVAQEGSYQLVYRTNTGTFYIIFYTPIPVILDIGLKDGDILEQVCVESGEIREVAQTSQPSIRTSGRVTVYSWENENGDVPWWQPEEGAERLFMGSGNETCFTPGQDASNLPPNPGGGGTSPATTVGGTTTTVGGTTTTVGGTTTTVGGTTTTVGGTTTTLGGTTTTTSTTTSSTTTTTTTTTTALPACGEYPSGTQGLRIFGGTTCWYLGNAGDSCTDVCTGKGYSSDTASVTGADDGNCVTALNALGVSCPGSFISGSNTYGCVNNTQSSDNCQRYNGTATTEGASLSFLERVCGCNN
jgi:hypothetical protein